MSYSNYELLALAKATNAIKYFNLDKRKQDLLQKHQYLQQRL